MKIKEVEIKIEATEQQVAESFLNLSHQNQRSKGMLILSLTAMARGWHKDKLFHYLKEGGVETS